MIKKLQQASDKQDLFYMNVINVPSMTYISSG